MSALTVTLAQSPGDEPAAPGKLAEYEVFAIRTFVVDTGFAEEVGCRRGRTVLRHHAGTFDSSFPT